MPKFLAGLVAGALVLCAGYALASRNSSGTMSAANGPYIGGTTISTSAVNSRFADIEAEITDSLSRSGKGGMSAALKGSDGTVAAPAFSWTSEPGTGWYRIGAGNPGLSVLGAKRMECTSTGCVVTGTLGVSGGTTLSGAATVTGSGQTSAGFNTSGSMLGSILLQDTANSVGSGGAVVFAGNNVNAFASIKGLLTSGLNNTTGDLTIGTRRVNTDATLTESVRFPAGGGIQIGSGGATISARLRGTVLGGTMSGLGPLGAVSSASTAVTVTGATTAGDCTLHFLSAPNPLLTAYCYVSSANTVTVLVGNPTAGSQSVAASGVSVVVEQP